MNKPSELMVALVESAPVEVSVTAPPLVAIAPLVVIVPLPVVTLMAPRGGELGQGDVARTPPSVEALIVIVPVPWVGMSARCPRSRRSG